MTALVEDLLLLARLDAGRPLAREKVDLSRLLVEAVSDARVLAPDHQWRLELPDDSVGVTGDEQRLHQVVTNLLTNARKYTPPGTTVTVRAHPGGFSVHDDGPGFPADLVDTAFERFARGDVSRSRGAATVATAWACRWSTPSRSRTAAACGSSPLPATPPSPSTCLRVGSVWSVTLPSHVDHLVVGAGFAGVALAIGLQDDGEDFLVIERADGLGGTWWANTYPGATCDVPSHLYSFSFAPNPDWSHAFSPQAEILAYLEKVAAEAGVLDRFHFGIELLEAAWDDEAQLWRVRTSAGELTSSTLINATGGLSAPKLPDIEGIETFAGPPVPHRRVGPRRRPRGQAGGRDRHGRLGHPGRAGDPAGGRPPRRLPALGALGDPARRPPVHGVAAAPVRAVPLLQRALRAGSTTPTRPWCRASPAGSGSTSLSRRSAVATSPRASGPRPPREADPALRRLLQADPDLRRLLPRHVRRQRRRRRPTRSLASPATGVVTADGVERPVDVIVVATGFRATDPPVAHLVRGRDGRTLAETWAGPA